MKGHCEGRRWFLSRAMALMALIGAFVIARNIGSSVRESVRDALTPITLGNSPRMKTWSDSPSSSFGADEEILLTALANAMFPADGNGPSATDVGLAKALIATASASNVQLRLFREGLGRIEAFSLKVYAKSVAQLSPDHLHQMLHHLDDIRRQIEREPSALKDKILRKLRYWYYAWQGALETADFWSQLQRDSIVAYYSHELIWKWLGYAGPPFPNGYVHDLRQ